MGTLVYCTATPYLRVRDTATVRSTNHTSNLTGITASTDPSLLSSDNKSCTLTPEVMEGLY
jgi:hypothetical protein